MVKANSTLDIEDVVTDFEPKRRLKKVKLTQDVIRDRGFFNLPKSIIIEALREKGINLKYHSDNGRNETYYKCVDCNCIDYKVKICEDKDKAERLATFDLTKNYKDFHGLADSELQEGVCKVTEYNAHIQNHNLDSFEEFKQKKQGTLFWAFKTNI